MAAKRYAVLNKNGIVVNHIMIADPMPKGYWPGYGKSLLCLDPNPDLTEAAGLVVLSVTPSVRPQIGDTINTVTGAVTKLVPTVIQQPNATGQMVNVMAAPAVKLEQDVAPTKGQGG